MSFQIERIAGSKTARVVISGLPPVIITMHDLAALRDKATEVLATPEVIRWVVLGDRCQRSPYQDSPEAVWWGSEQVASVFAIDDESARSRARELIGMMRTREQAESALTSPV